MHVLIVDDEHRTRKGLKSFISWNELGVTEIREAEDGIFALEVVDSFKPDLLITDVRMPRMDGIALATEIRKRFPLCRIIFLSGYSDKEYLMSAIQLNADSYVEKPIKVEEISDAVKKAIRLLQEEHKKDKGLEALFGLQSTIHRAESLEDIKSFLKRKEADAFDSVAQSSSDATGSALDILKYIKKHFAAPGLSVKSIAADLHLTHTYLCRIFKRATGKTINDYICEIRMEKAKELLKDRRIKLYEISQKVGYSQTGYFVKLFRKYEGCTPSEYKDRYRL